MLAQRHFFSPGRTVLLSIFIAICLGTGLLLLPSAQRYPISFIDCLFTATSATCVVGILTVPIDAFTLFGKTIIMILIQIGGIGLLTMTLFLMTLFVNLGIVTKQIIGEVLETESWHTTRHILFFIISMTIICELLGATAIFFLISDQYEFYDALFNALFHSVSSFCSAGLSIFGASLIPFKNSPLFLQVTGLLILLGTFGFVTWYELLIYYKRRMDKKRYNLSLSSRVIILMTSIFIFLAAFMLLLLEHQNHFSNYPCFTTLTNMLFNAISYRSTGFTTMDISTMQTATLFLILMYSFIGSSPGSTGAGIKVTTFTIFLATIRAVVTGKDAVELKGRTIPQDQIFKSIAVLSLSVCWVVLSTFLLLLIEPQHSFLTIFFEIVSSFTTLGLATPVTPYLSSTGKLLVVLNMFIGRLGSLTLLFALRAGYVKNDVKYPEERIMMG